MSSIQHLVVVLPAHNEAERIRALLASVRESSATLARHRPAVGVRVFVVADGCTDTTAAIAGASGAEVLERHRCGVGAARATGIAHALASASVPAERLWIANTDADSIVPSDWLLTHVTQGCDYDALLGTVRPHPADLTAAAYKRWQRSSAKEEQVGSIHGANLGVRASAYLAAGGFGSESVHEDVLLVHRLRASGAKVGATADGEVVTSGRRNNRVIGGYGGYLHAHVGQADATAVPDRLLTHAE
ncbi:glycosyltransferase [Rathayibacter toxicus]|uniref:glycosyltransferase n=1 Tax=Rathayibacter toxicus TaxID=145458 RepID=UPI000CE86E1E|nr:glycosyltransferase [Rathayibacter toxicus]PPI53184.1 glycosyl transferase [Rathayibacter toxicus]QOD10748.1 glycosyltransferase [Rathayibacter toxicus]